MPPFLKAFMEQEGVPPKSRAQTPESSSSANASATAPWKSALSNAESLPHMPSIVAHSQPLHLPKNLASSVPVFQAEAIDGAQRISTQNMSVFSMPSVAAHSRPSLISWLLSLNTPVVKNQRGKGRPARKKAPATLETPTLESIHLQSQQTKPSSLGTSGGKQNYVSKDVSQQDDVGSFQYLPSLLAHTQSFFNEQNPPPLKRILVLSFPLCVLTRKGGSWGVQPKRKQHQNRVCFKKKPMKNNHNLFREMATVFSLVMMLYVQELKAKEVELRTLALQSLNLLAYVISRGSLRKQPTQTSPGDSSNAMPIDSTLPSKTELPPTLPLVLASSPSSLSNLDNGMGEADIEHVLSNKNRNGSKRKRDTESKMAGKRRVLKDFTPSKSKDILVAETNCDLTERSEVLRGGAQTISNLPPTTSPFTPVNRVDDSVSRETINLQASREPNTTNRNRLSSSRTPNSLFNVPVIIDPHPTRNALNDLPPESNLVHASGEPEISNPLPSKLVLEATGSKERLNDEREIQPRILTANSPSENIGTDAFEPLATIPDPSMSPKIMRTLFQYPTTLRVYYHADQRGSSSAIFYE